MIERIIYAVFVTNGNLQGITLVLHQTTFQEKKEKETATMLCTDKMHSVIKSTLEESVVRKENEGAQAVEIKVMRNQIEKLGLR